MPLGPTASYLARFNGYTLPGYVQNESFDSALNISSHYGAYIDGSNSEDTGLSNKNITLRLKVWEQNYLTCKEQIELAATMVRSIRNRFAPLYVGYTDRHYLAMTKMIKTEKEASTSTRTAEYDVDFEAKPWLISDIMHTLSGTGIIDTDQVSRDISRGGWTPTVVTVTGTDVTISGYTSTGEFTGYLAVSGTYDALVIDSENFTATVSGENMNEAMLIIDYRLFVGIGKTHFLITGASDCTIDYYDRWHI